MKIPVVLILFVICSFGLNAQTRRPGEKPVLIREEVIDREEAVITHDPAQAKKSVEVGDYYFKKDNWAAAEKRYREAIQYNRGWAEPYEKLIQTLEKRGDVSAAIEICELFADTNPTSEKVENFRERARELDGSRPGGSG